jgi:uncharacterized protein (DUF433 family)
LTDAILLDRGTRLPAQTLFESLEAGMSVEGITEVFDLSPET